MTLRGENASLPPGGGSLGLGASETGYGLPGLRVGGSCYVSPRAVVLSVFALVLAWRTVEGVACAGGLWELLVTKLLKLISIIVSIILRQCMSHYVCSAGWPGTIVDEADLELTEIFLPLL